MTTLLISGTDLTEGQVFLAAVIAMPKGRPWTTCRTQALRQGKILVDSLEGKLPQKKLHELLETLYTIKGGTAPEMARLLHIADVMGNINPIFRQPMLDCLVEE